MKPDRAPDAGFSIVEVLVALAIIALGLAAFCQAAGNSYRAAAGLKIRAAALASTRSHLELVGVESPLLDGIFVGRHGNGLPWRLTVSTLAPATGATGGTSRAYWVALETFDRRGASLVRLETIKLNREQP